MPHALSSFSCKDVLRYFNRRINQSGEIPANFNGTVQINLKQYPEGQRVKYALNGNSIKNYDKAYTAFGNVLRAAETTINNVKGYKEYRTKEGDPDGPQSWRVARKGIAGIYRRVEISRQANDRAIDALASIDSSRRVEELTEAIQRREVGGRCNASTASVGRGQRTAASGGPRRLPNPGASESGPASIALRCTGRHGH